jgi:alanine racemase
MRHSSYLEVNLDLLHKNVEKIKFLSKSKLIPMVKADAYGNGLVPVSRFLVEECGIQKLGCASLGEALTLFQQCPQLNADMIVFSDTELKNEKVREAYLNHRITPVVHLKSDLEILLRPEFKTIPLHLKINTGMNRLGLSLDELAEVAPKLKSRGVQHLMTHFACSYYPIKANDKTNRQVAEFEKARGLLKNAGVDVAETSVSNSGAIEQNIGCDQTYVRPGLMMYGPYSVEPRIWDGHQISKLVTKVIKTFSVKKGTPVGYGINVAGEDGFIAVIALGYGDGLSTYSTGTELVVNGLKARLFARVNMDMAFLMFDPAAEGKIKEEMSVEIWNHDNRVIADLATQMKTIPYALMCGITSRIPRIYKVH